MKRSIATWLLVTTIAFASAQESFSAERRWKLGETDRYSFVTDMKGSVNLKITLSLKQTVKQVFENGDAEIETVPTDVKVLANGNEIPLDPAQLPKPVTQRLNKLGQGAQKADGIEALLMMGFGIASLLPADGLKSGQETAVDFKDPQSSESVKGSFKVESVVSGVAKVVSDLQFILAKATKPLTVRSTLLWDVASAKINRIDGVALNVPSEDALQIDSLTFVMERIRS
jgi:hypothetical protein